MSEIERIKEDILHSLETSFVENKSEIEKEMNMLNVLITSFCDDEYKYDEYCQCRMKFELKGCDYLDVDVDSDMDIDEQEQMMIHNKAMKKHMSDPNSDYDEIIKDEFVKLHSDKFYNIDKEMFYKISKYSNLKLIANKIPFEIWNQKKEYFDDICESKARKYGRDIAEANKGRHEDDIRTSMI